MNVMPGTMRLAQTVIHANESQTGRATQLRLPLMRAEAANGLPSPNPARVEFWRRFLVRHSAAQAKDVALATGARSARVHNENEGRTVFSAGTLAALFLALPSYEQKRFINDLCALASLPPYEYGLRDLDDSFSGVAR